MKAKYAAIIAAATIMAAMPVVAQAPVRSERVQFARGASAATIRGTLRGYDTIDYVVGAQAGQTMSVSLQATNASTYFNVLPPRSQEAIFNSSLAGGRFSRRLGDTGDYRVRVYMMRNAARRGERTSYSLAVAVGGRPGGGAGTTPAPIGQGAPISAGNMAAYCRGEASQQYGVRPSYITTGRIVADRGGSMIEGTADQGRNGTKRFRCRFDSRNRFIDVMALTRDGF